MRNYIIDYLKIAGGISMTSPLIYAFFRLEKVINPFWTTFFIYVVLIIIGICVFNYLQSGENESIH